MVLLPGTTMPIPVADPTNRRDVIAYLATLKIPPSATLKYQALPETAGGTDPNDWQRQAPGAQHHFKVADLPPPNEKESAGNGPEVVAGYKVIRVLLNHGVPTGQYDDFMTGFVVDNHSVWGRPVGVTVARDGALLITEDGNGTMWRVAYE